MPYLYSNDAKIAVNHFRKAGRSAYQFAKKGSRYARRRLAVSTALLCEDWDKSIKQNVENWVTLKTWAGYVFRSDEEKHDKVILELHGKFALVNFQEIREKLIAKARQEDLEGFKICDPSESEEYKYFSIEHSEICNSEQYIQSEIIKDSIEYMISIFDPIFQEYEDNKAKLREEIIRSESKVLPDDRFDVDNLNFYTWNVAEIPFRSLQIPFYQRSYRWGLKQVNQLINDVIEFSDNTASSKDVSYRLGSVVLHKNDIVDGQQRLVTLSLLLYSMWINPRIRKNVECNGEVGGFISALIDFWNRISYKDPVAFANVSLNLELIKERESELSSEFFMTVLNKCQFVVIILPTSSEAFQFFDSQNARGKDLEAHDLLKAFHLRDIPENSFDENRDGANIDTWQKEKTETMKALFLTLYRIKQWSAGNSAQYFRKSDINAFKGLSLVNYEKDPRFRLPCYDSAYLLAYLYELFVKQPELKNANCPDKYPFQIDGTVINGSQFFDMIVHYLELYNEFTDKKNNVKWFHEHLTGEEERLATMIIDAVNTYPTYDRVGDSYISSLFYSLILYYYDKFGTEKLGTAISKFFVYAYSIRLTSSSVYRSSVDKKAYSDEFFRTIKNANTPFDVLNIYVPSLTENQARTRNIPELFKVFNELKKIK